MFKQIPEDEAVLVQGGVFKVAQVYEYNGGLYAKVGSGFVRLKADGSTSHPGIKLETLQRDAPLFRDQFGRICTGDGEGRRPLRLETVPGEGRFLPSPEAA